MGEEIEDLRKISQNLRSEIIKLQKEQVNLNSQNANLLTENDELHKKVTQRGAELLKAEESLEDVLSKLGWENRKLDRLYHKTQELSDEVEELLRKKGKFESLCATLEGRVERYQKTIEANFERQELNNFGKEIKQNVGKLHEEVLATCNDELQQVKEE